MPERTLTSDELTALLERFPLERAVGRTSEEATEAQLQLLLARVAALTDILRGAAPTETARLVSRLLLSDLAAIAAHFRGRANTMESQLARGLDGLRAALARTEGLPDTATER